MEHHYITIHHLIEAFNGAQPSAQTPRLQSSCMPCSPHILRLLLILAAGKIFNTMRLSAAASFVSRSSTRFSSNVRARPFGTLHLTTATTAKATATQQTTSGPYQSAFQRSSVTYPSALSSSSLLSSSRRMMSSMATGEEMMLALSDNGRKTLEGNEIPSAMEALVNADCVCFDVDSTVVNEEGIDVLADYLGQGEAVANLTKQAMEGGMKFQDALAARLQLLQPAKASIEDCLRDRPLELTAGVAELIQTLQDGGKDVYLVSGGFRIMIEPLAEILNIPKSNIVANTILFDDEGKYKDFDAQEPTSQDMGKPKALQQIQAANSNYKTMVMVGDGATDAQAKPPAAAFIGFGGVVVREKVKAQSDWFVTDFADMIRLLSEYPSTK